MTQLPLSQLSESTIEPSLRGRGLSLQVGKFRSLLFSDTGLLSEPLRGLYADYPAAEGPSGFYDFRLRLTKRRSNFWSEWKVEFGWDGSSPFPPLPIAQAHPLFEWGLNWCVATASGVHVVIHSAVVERDGFALVLPGQPGSGKSTLCAALMLSGWRILSDELTIVCLADGLVQPVPRPVSLKGTSIDIIRERFPQASMTAPVTATHKGAIAYVRPSIDSVVAFDQAVPIGHIVFPKFKSGTDLAYEPLPRAVALTELMDNTFNVGLLGSSGFHALARSISSSKCFAVEYGDLSSIVQWVNSTCTPPR